MGQGTPRAKEENGGRLILARLMVIGLGQLQLQLQLGPLPVVGPVITSIYSTTATP